MSKVAKIFRSGNSQAVRLPREFRFNVDEVEITREGDAIILRPHVDDDAQWSGLCAALERGVSEDFMNDGREQPEQQDRSDLDRLFR